MEFNLNDKVIKVDKKVLIGIGALILFVLLLIVFNLTKSKTSLVCEQKINNATVNATEKITFKFKKNHLYKMVSYYKNEPTPDFKYMLQEIYDNYKNQLDKLKENGGYDYSISLEDSYVETEATIDIDNIPDSTKDAVGFNNAWLYKDVKANLEEHGFTCK